MELNGTGNRGGDGLGRGEFDGSGIQQIQSPSLDPVTYLGPTHVPLPRPLGLAPTGSTTLVGSATSMGAE